MEYFTEPIKREKYHPDCTVNTEPYKFLIRSDNAALNCGIRLCKLNWSVVQGIVLERRRNVVLGVTQ
jgi:hypothetical protein